MRFLLLGAFLLLTSCQAAPLYMSVEQKGGALIVEVFTKWWFGLRSNETPCVHDVELVRDANDGRVLWRMSVPPDRQCADLRSFVVGRAPKGFRDEVPLASPLAPGDYTLSALGIGYGQRDFNVPLLDG
jgi:hypothetical protein